MYQTVKGLVDSGKTVFSPNVNVTTTDRLKASASFLGELSGASDVVKGAKSLVRTANAVDNAGDATKAATRLPDDAPVVRGGQNTPESFAAGSGVTVDSAGKLDGVSVNSAPSATVEQLSAGLPHTKVGVTTVGAVRSAGGDVVPSPTVGNPNHCTMCGITPEKASQLMKVVPNPTTSGKP
jgi:hypothetical protein